MSFRRWGVTKILEEFAKLPDKHKYEIVDCSEVKKAKDNIKFKCLTCNTIFNSTCNNFFNVGTRCSVCSYKQMTKEIVTQKFNQLNDKKDFLLIYVPDNCNSQSKITIQCRICNEKFYPRCWDFFYHKSRCPICQGHRSWDSQRVKEEFSTTHDKDMYELINIQRVTTGLSKFTVKCLTCEYIWETTPANYFVSKRRCPVCKASSGERLIYCHLKSRNIKFEVEKTFPSLKLKNKLRFDFYLPEYNLVIEFHGQHHFHKINGLKITQKRLEFNREKDAFKRNFALMSGMNYLEIHYCEITWATQIIDTFIKTCVALY